MPAKDVYHDAFIHALLADGWTIIGAERTYHKIAVEVKSFLSHSPVQDLEEAVGQCDIYRALLAETEPDRQLYLAVPQRAYDSIFAERFGQLSSVASMSVCWFLIHTTIGRSNGYNRTVSSDSSSSGAGIRELYPGQWGD